MINMLRANAQSGVILKISNETCPTGELLQAIIRGDMEDTPHFCYLAAWTPLEAFPWPWACVKSSAESVEAMLSPPAT